MATKEKKTITITNKIAETLKQDINYGKIPPGEVIIERKIAERFQASNIPVREALRILEGEGFIIHRKFSGYSVRQINPEEMVELYDIITYLSGQLLSRGIPRYTELTYHRFRTLIEEMDKSKDTDKTVSLLIEFAEAAYAPAGLKYSLELAMQILNRNIPLIQGMVEKIYKGTIPTRFQRQFMELCQQKDTKKAIEICVDEFEQMTKGFVAIISNYKP
ncbi:MAG TPA: GntR family transcriptional regulator [Bacteroidales bacterium]|nr:GntR family transcriptional regulator [Bacteroidales bacterium]